MPAYQNKFPPFALNPGDSVYLFGVPNTAAAIAAGPGGLSRNAAGTVTATTSAAHNFAIGQRVAVKGSNSAAFPGLSDAAAIYGFDGEYTILTVPSTTTLTYFDPNKPVDTGGGGVAVSVAAEQPTPGAATGQGSQFGIPLEQMGVQPLYAAELWFTGAPGAYEVDIQEADSDADAAYALPLPALANTAAKVNGAADGNNHFRSGAIPLGGKFGRATVITRTNAVGLVLKLSRVA